MIQLNELRIGNWVIWNEDETFMRIGATSFLLPEDRFNPIPLTPEILEMCGFKTGFGTEYNTVYSKTYKTYRFGMFAVAFNLNGYALEYRYVCGQENREDEVLKLMFLHQLQNLYFYLTGGEELPTLLKL